MVKREFKRERQYGEKGEWWREKIKGRGWWRGKTGTKNGKKVKIRERTVLKRRKVQRKERN